MHLTKIPRWKLFTITPMEKSKSEKSPWVKKTKKTAQRRKEKLHFVKQRKKPCISDKGSWFGQTPTKSLASTEDPELSKTLLVRVLLLPLPTVGDPVFPLVCSFLGVIISGHGVSCSQTFTR